MTGRFALNLPHNGAMRLCGANMPIVALYNTYAPMPRTFPSNMGQPGDLGQTASIPVLYSTVPVWWMCWENKLPQVPMHVRV